ncbi:MAG: hypothetical protein JNK33_01730 [Candidatus Doudnabacteria bacterium]|nr:hypothetical protein [Candidatus Doudnabacteria bacterium]
MRFKRTLQLLVAIAAIALVGLGIAYARKGTDLANGVKPVSQEFFADNSFRETLAELAKLPPGEMEAKLRADHPGLENRLLSTLRRHNKLGVDEKVESVRFFFAKDAKGKADDGDGKQHTGFIKDQLLATVKPAGRDAFTVIVLCLNGALFEQTQLQQAQELSLSIPVMPVADNSFEVLPGHGLMPPLDFEQAIKAAEANDLQLFIGPISGGQRISYARAAKVGPRYRGQPITVLVQPGRYKPE